MEGVRRGSGTYSGHHVLGPLRTGLLWGDYMRKPYPWEEVTDFERVPGLPEWVRKEEREKRVHRLVVKSDCWREWKRIGDHKMGHLENVQIRMESQMRILPDLIVFVGKCTYCYGTYLGLKISVPHRVYPVRYLNVCQKSCEWRCRPFLYHLVFWETVVVFYRTRGDPLVLRSIIPSVCPERDPTQSYTFSISVTPNKFSQVEFLNPTLTLRILREGFSMVGNPIVTVRFSRNFLRP